MSSTLITNLGGEIEKSLKLAVALQMGDRALGFLYPGLLLCGRRV